MLKARTKAYAAVAAVLTLGTTVLAQAPTMPAIDEVIDYASIVTALVAAGVAVLLVAYPVRIGFKMAHKVIARMWKAV